ncbi:c-type cytochrome [Methylogaea oryzae]|nr:c-type cytochrome [Methylogaea oryzae]
MKNMQWAFFVLAATLAGTAWAEGNGSNGRLKAEMCEGCHGAAGNSETPIFPKLAGQNSGYLAKQLMDFREQKRADPTMNAIAAGLNDQDIADIAAYYAAQKIHSEPPVNTPLGKRLYLSGNPAAGVPACSACHGPDGSGNAPARYPALAGQHAAYIAKTLGDFKTQARANDANAVIRTIAAKLSTDEVNALADYIAGLPGKR